jgi:hypothetical protein
MRHPGEEVKHRDYVRLVEQLAVFVGEKEEEACS